MSHSSCARQVRERRAVSLLTAGLLTAAFACAEPTAPSRTLNPETAALAAGGNQNVKVRIFRLSTNTLRIEGPSVSGDASIFNPGPAIPAGVSMQAVVTQGAATREAANAPLACLGTPGDVGKLPSGGCDIMFDARASNLTPGSGTLVSGPAVLVLRVIAGATELASKSLNVNLVGTPGIAALSLAATTLAIDGPETNYTATLVNPANSLQNVILQGWIVQGPTTRVESDRRPVDCGSSMGVFPPGSCTITSPAPVSSSAPGEGTLVPGAATFELQLIQRTGGTSTILDTKTVAITLVSGSPTIVSITPATSNVFLDAATGVSIDIANPGLAISTIIVQGSIRQGEALRAAGGRTLACGPALGTLPNGGCVQEQFIVASNSNGGGGTLVPGSATYEVELIHFDGTSSTILDTESIPITLVANTPPTIVSITPANYIVLDKIGWVNSISVNISNPGAPLSNVVTQAYIRQGTALHAAGGANLSCDGPLTGNLPNGECVEERRISAFNTPGGTGSLAPGDATLELELVHFDGSVSTILDTKSVPILLVANIPSIVSVTLASTSLVIDGPRVNYTATLYNPSFDPLDGVLIQTYVDQISTASSMPAGGVILSCTGTNGEMPPGACVVSFNVGAANSPLGAGALVPGEAYIRMELRRNGALIWTTLVPITLTSP